MLKVRMIAFLVLAATSLVDHNDSALAKPQPCRSKEYAHNAYTICEVDLGKHTVRLYWKRSDGTPYAYLSSLPRAPEHETGKLLFAANAGMFDPALKPVGLYVEQGRELVRVSTASGYGNFHMKKWFRNFAQDDKWNFRLTAGTLVPANQERPYEETTAPEPHTGFQGESGHCGDQG